ncbi:MAG: sigma-70 family RNA polymerase sigma factor [Ilumatobacter sp.]|uniref:sigma-70 family RNA polymerase sigma factor n=1 Tax=Ilumatobacter sp. TaxID=1967498 RepID=UPI003C74CD46
MNTTDHATTDSSGAAPTTGHRRPTFDELYREAYTPMLRLASLLVDTVGEAEHVVQDAFVAMYRRYDTVRNPGGYLRVSVVNGCRKTLRRRRLLRRRPEEREEHDELVFNHVIDEIKQLPVDQRILVGLRYDQQMTDSEIADELGIPIGTVKSRLHRAISTLRTSIGQESR